MSPRRTVRRRALLSGVLGGLVVLGGACSDDDDAASDTLATAAVTSAPPVTTEPATTGEAPTTTPPTTATPPTTTPPTTAAPPTTAPPATTPASTAPPTTVAPPTTAASPAAVSLGSGGLGVVELGAGADDTIAALAAAFGAPTEDSGWVDPRTIGECPGSEVRIVSWNSLSVLLGEPPGAAAGARQFLAYAYGDVSQAGVEPAGLVTAEGVGLGSTVDELRAAYPQVDVLPGEEGLLEPAFAVDQHLTGLLTSDQADGAVTAVFGGLVPYCA